MFLDASAVIAIIARESDWRELSARLATAQTCFASPISVWESVRGLQKLSRSPFQDAENLVDDFLSETNAKNIAIDQAVGQLALTVSRQYGRGFHPAALNMGDCFAYACAKTLGVPLLAKGNDFPQTDIELA